MVCAWLMWVCICIPPIMLMSNRDGGAVLARDVDHPSHLTLLGRWERGAASDQAVGERL
jgi:hypothetical protein